MPGSPTYLPLFNRVVVKITDAIRIAFVEMINVVEIIHEERGSFNLINQIRQNEHVNSLMHGIVIFH